MPAVNLNHTPFVGQDLRPRLRFSAARCVEPVENAPNSPAFRFFLSDSSSLSEGRQLFFEFVSTWLTVQVFGVQGGCTKGDGTRLPDTFLFQGPFGSTMAVETDVMLLSRDAAVSKIQARIAEKKKQFGV